MTQDHEIEVNGNILTVRVEVNVVYDVLPRSGDIETFDTLEEAYHYALEPWER